MLAESKKTFLALNIDDYTDSYFVSYVYTAIIALLIHTFDNGVIPLF